MVTSIIEDVKREFESGNNITRLILVNVGLFAVFALFRAFANFSAVPGQETWFDSIWHLFVLSNDFVTNLKHPWALITHMFLHQGFWHILWNMLLLYWFGRRVGDLLGEKHVYPIYIYGGLACAAAYLISDSIFHYIPIGVEGLAWGASGAVMAIIVAAAMLSPDSYMHLLLIGPVKLKYIAIGLVFLDIISLGDNYNTGGHFGHLGGAVMGWFYIYALRNGWDLAPDFSRKSEEKKSNVRVMSDYRPSPKRQHAPSKSFKQYFTRSEENDEAIVRNIDEEIDRILDKIKVKGIDSLTDKERETLNRASKEK